MKRMLFWLVAIAVGPPAYIAGWLFLFKSWAFIFNTLLGLIHA